MMRACSVLVLSILALSRCVAAEKTGEAAANDANDAAAASRRDLQDGSGSDIDMVELQVRAFNAPPGALDEIEADAARYMRFLLGAEPTYSGIEPGEAVPEDEGGRARARDRRTRAAAAAAAAGETREGNGTPMIRGAAKGRNLLYSCPTTCAKSSSTSCKQLGCAYCGTRCRRRRRERELEAFEGKVVTKIEGKINARLLRACGDVEDCVIFAKIHPVGSET